MEKLDFKECKICKKKTGSPQLCPSCIQNRFTITKMNQFLDALYEICPEFKADVLENFDGYFTSFDKFIKAIGQSWEGGPGCYGNHPFELIGDLCAERDDALEDVKNLKKTINSKALVDVGIERQRQDNKLGGPTHDDKHPTAQFVQWIRDFAGWARMLDSMKKHQETRKRLIQVAALAVAAVESLDRKNESTI